MIVPIRGLLEGHLTVSDLERSRLFYGGLLGLELAQVFPERNAAFLLGWEAEASPCWACGTQVLDRSE